jgi:tRNA threonylcarbamoyladenosine biosynthesis protein TsaE
LKRKTISVRALSVDETRAWGQRLGQCLRQGDVVLLFATLGGGKTTFTQGLLKGLGGREWPQSPTFIMAQTFRGRVPLHHMDFYRLSARELIAKGVQDYFNGEGAITPGVVVVEWPERCRALWPKERLDVKLRVRRNPAERTLEFVPHGPRFESIVNKIVIPERLSRRSTSKKGWIPDKGFRE